VKYWLTSEASVRPKVSRSACIASGASRPRKRAKSAVAGSPGMSRGRKKLRVSATHAAIK
jgi:hypothetical protein